MPPIKAPAAMGPRELQLSELVLPRLANHYGTLFGPEALALLGRSAYLLAASHCRQAVVMAAAQDIVFLAPVPVGSLLQLRAAVLRRGRSSLSVAVSATLDGPGGAAEVLRARFEMVAVDGQGRPTPLPQEQNQEEIPA